MSALTRRYRSSMPEAPSSVLDSAPAAVCADGRILLNHLAGDRTAFARLVRSFASPIYAYLTRTGVSPPERDDLFQDVFCKVLHAAHQFDPSRPIKPWIFAIAVNTVRSHLRKQCARQGTPLQLVRAAWSPATAPPDAVLEARETARWLAAELARLPLPQREVVALCCIEQLPQREVASALGLPVNTVKTHLRRARMTMARALTRRRKQQGGEVSA